MRVDSVCNVYRIIRAPVYEFAVTVNLDDAETKDDSIYEPTYRETVYMWLGHFEIDRDFRDRTV